MAGIRVDIIPGLAAALVGHEVVKAARQEAAEKIADKARAMAPVGSEAEWDHHPGEYRDSIEAVNGVVVSETDHSTYVEFGVPSRGIAPKFTFHRAAIAAGFKFKR